MIDLNREVGGIRCVDVLASLSDYLAGEVTEERRQAIEAHLRGCDHCERFGGRMGQLIAALRASLGDAGPLPADVARRLRRRLAQVR